MDTGNATRRTRVGVGLLLLPAILGFVVILLGLETSGALSVALISLMLGISGASVLSAHLCRDVARKIVIAYVLLVTTLFQTHFLFILLPDSYGWRPPYLPYISYIPSSAGPYGLALRLVLQGGPIVAGLTLGIVLRILAGKWPRFKRLVDTEKRKPETIAAVLAAVLISPTLVSEDNLALWVEWAEVIRGIANQQFISDPVAWGGVAIILALFAIGMVARARGRSSRALWNRLAVMFAILFVPAYARTIIVDLAPIAKDAPIAWVFGPITFALVLLVILAEATFALLVGSWTMALIRRR